MAKHPAWNIFSIRVGPFRRSRSWRPITHDQGDQCEVDTFLLLPRHRPHIETALLPHRKSAAERAASAWSSVPATKKCSGARFHSQHKLDSWKEWRRFPLVARLTRQQVPFPMG